MWACVSSTKAMSRGWNANRSFFASAPPPWNMPQSTRNRISPVSTSKQEPVTSAAAPWNVRRKAEAVVRFVEVGDDVLELIQSEVVLGLRGPACHGVAQVGEVLHIGLDALVHTLVVA